MTTNVAGPMNPRTDTDQPASGGRSRLDRLPASPPDAEKPARSHIRSMMSRFSGANKGQGKDSGGDVDNDNDNDNDNDASASSSIRTLAASNPLFAALSVSKDIESKIPLLARFAPKTAANLQLLLRSGITDELMGGGQSALAPQFSPGAPQSLTPPPNSLPPGMPGNGTPNPMLSAPAPPAPGMLFGG